MLRQKTCAFILAVLLAFSTSGCVMLAVGAAGVVGGYVISPDTVEGSIARSMDETWMAVQEITGIMGRIVEENANQGVLVSEIAAARVTVTLVAVNSTTTKITVKARKSFMPKIDLAQDVYIKIVNSFDR
jgi:N-acetylglucosamine kinase-like BadF-type ATPase